MRVYAVEEGLWQISLAWSNAWLLWQGEEATLIDTGLQADRDGLRAALQQIGVDEAKVRTVLLTHAHCDHAGNAAYFAEGAGQSAVHLHQDERPFLALPRRTHAPPGWGTLLRPHTALAFAIGEIRYPVARIATGLVSHADGDLIETPGGTLRVVASPGHTPGHIAFYRERDGVLFSGDAVLNIIPIKREIGLSLPIRFLSSDWPQSKASARQLAALHPRLLLSGHGPPLREQTAERLNAWAASL